MARLTRAERRARRNVKGVVTVPAWAPDPDEETWERRTTDPIDNTSQISDRVVRYMRNNQLIEFAVIYEEFEDGEYRERLCIDTCNHGTVHRHVNGDHDSEPAHIGDLDPDTLEERHYEAIAEAYDLWGKRKTQ